MQFVENNVKEFKKENVEHYLTRIHQSPVWMVKLSGISRKSAAQWPSP